MSIKLTPKAIKEVKSIMEAQQLGPETVLRMVITGGGCSGMQYALGFDTVYDPLVDARHDNDGVVVVTDKKFDLFLEGTEISFLDTEMAKGFSIDNPNFPQGAGCAGCGGH